MTSTPLVFTCLKIIFIVYMKLHVCHTMKTMRANKLLLVSMDGFRSDYIDKISTPNLRRFARMSVKAPYVDSVFTTLTFPTHYTIATGLYTECHGIINNRMYDPETGKRFYMGTNDPWWWNGGEPIWVTAKKQGKKTACYFWPGSEVEIRGVRPDIWLPYSNDPPFTGRVNTIIDWFINKEVDFATLYFHEPDKTGHTYGPNSQELLDKTLFMDAVFGYLIDRFDKLCLWNKINVILTSDHGMTDIDVVNKVIDLTDYVKGNLLQEVPSEGAVANILPQTDALDQVYRSLTGAHPNMKVFKRQDVPDFWHYSNNKRILPLVAVADEGWYITTNRSRVAQYAPTFKATHGYDNRLMSMKPIFLASGPHFRHNYKGKVFSAVDIYPLMCHILGIKPAPNNGTLRNTAGYLRKGDNGCGERDWDY